jgi:tRNA pseudouridine32 synthase/23S rRNA pseudouridine746 synthase
MTSPSDELELAPAAPARGDVAVVYRDTRLLVLNKPSGLLAVPGRGPHLQDCLASRVQAVFPDARVVHRLDRDTSGLMLMARDADAQRQVSRQFEQRQVHKVYECIVWGVPTAAAGRIDLPIGRDPDHPPRYQIDHVHGRSSQTDWHMNEPLGDRARLVVEPITGRSHQIRLHLAASGHAILGDPLYANAAALAAATRLLLHARELQLTHPSDGRSISWQSACPF